MDNHGLTIHGVGSLEAHTQNSILSGAICSVGTSAEQLKQLLGLEDTDSTPIVNLQFANGEQLTVKAQADITITPHNANKVCIAIRSNA